MYYAQEYLPAHYARELVLVLVQELVRYAIAQMATSITDQTIVSGAMLFVILALFLDLVLPVLEI